MKYFFILVILAFFYSLYPLHAQQYQADSLIRSLEGKEGEERIKILKILADILKSDHPKMALKFAHEILDDARENNSSAEEAEAMRLLGNIYRAQDDYPPALDLYLKSLKLFEKEEDKKSLANVLNSIGIIYFKQKKDSLALHYYTKSTSLAEEIGDMQGLANTYNNIASIFHRKEDFKGAQEYLEKALAINQKLKNTKFAAANLLNIGYVYLDQKKYDKTLQYGQKAYKEYEGINDKDGIAASLCFIASIYRATDSVDKAMRYASEALQIASEINAILYIQQSSEILFNIFIERKDYENAYFNYYLFNASKDSLEKEESRREIAKIEFNSELENQKVKNQLLEEEKKHSDYTLSVLRFSLVGAFGILIVITSLVVNISKSNARIKKQAKDLEKANRQITLSNGILTEQKEIIEQRKADIESSINYAKRIQDAILPYDETISNGLPEHFVLLKPRDVVSGDFYWYMETEPQPLYAINPNFPGKPSVLKGFTAEKLIIAAIDCTGHGIPGAFMSMIGNSLLNEIVVEKGITEPNLILNQLHKSVRKSLKQQEQKTYDGMDVAICAIDLENKILEYAGAHNPLIYIQDNQLFHIKGDGYGIGGHQIGIERIFTKHTIDISKKTEFYIFSDGYQDQFGGEKGKKFMKKNLYQLLFEISPLPMPEQLAKLESTLQEWMGNYAQVDDILMFGARI